MPGTRSTYHFCHSGEGELIVSTLRRVRVKKESLIDLDMRNTSSNFIPNVLYRVLQLISTVSVRVHEFTKKIFLHVPVNRAVQTDALVLNTQDVRYSQRHRQ